MTSFPKKYCTQLNIKEAIWREKFKNMDYVTASYYLSYCVIDMDSLTLDI